MKFNQDDRSTKRHCMVVHAYYPLGETRVEREAHALIDHGFEVDVICLQKDGELPVDITDKVNIYRLPVKRRKERGRLMQLVEYLTFFMLAFAKLLVLHSRRSYGTVQVHNLPDFLIFAGLGPKLAGARLILDLHDLMPEFYASLMGGTMTSWPVRLVALQERLCCRFADHVITVTEGWREALIQRGVPPEKVSVVMNVADSQIFHRHLEAQGVIEKDGNFSLIYHGTFTRRYGVDLIIRAVAKVRDQIPSIHLHLIGAGEYRDELEKLTDELELHEHVSLSQDLMPVSELPAAIRQSDVGVVPNRSDVFTDGLLPTKLMEYVAMGTPVIAARTPTIANYFDDTMVQFFSPGDTQELADSILELHADRSRLLQLVHNSNKFNQKHSWPQVAAEYVDLVERLHS